MSNNTPLTRILQAILFLLFASWLVLFIVNPVRMAPDSYGYIADSKNLFDPSYQTMRPVLFPFFLRILNSIHLKMSITTYLLNCASLLYLVKMAAGSRPLFSLRNTIVLICFFMLTGIWSYSGIYLTESILFSVELWIFVLLLKIIFPERKMNQLITILYSLLICLLATTLKPWIMIMVLLGSTFLFLASLILRSFRPKIRSSFILLAVSVVSFIVSLGYNRSKSQEKANMVVLMISSGNEDALKERLANDKSLSSESAEFITAILSDIQLINSKYKKNPWAASATTELKVLNISDKKYAPSIDKAFHIMYFQRVKDVFGLILLSFERHISELRFDTSCFEIAYGPELPGLRTSAVIIICGFVFLLTLYRSTRPDPSGTGKVGLKPIRQFLKENEQLSVFIGIVLFAGILFSLLLTLAGADELKRTVLPAALFQLFALAWLTMKFGNFRIVSK
ncbi:MAG TPA: hypothetical protein VL727_11240 [Puia sp.]|nr:hypothetical protein [Puia sp.]